jgi:hypothetical protein
MVVGGGILLRMATRASYEMTLLAYRLEGQSALQILLKAFPIQTITSKSGRESVTRTRGRTDVTAMEFFPRLRVARGKFCTLLDRSARTQSQRVMYVSSKRVRLNSELGRGTPESPTGCCRGCAILLKSTQLQW